MMFGAMSEVFIPDIYQQWRGEANKRDKLQDHYTHPQSEIPTVFKPRHELLLSLPKFPWHHHVPIWY
jgi:hypothetical protein